MNRTRRILVSTLIIAFVISGCGLNSATPTAAPPPTAAPTATTKARNTVIVLGEISDEPSKKIERLQPLTDYVGKRLDKVGVTSAQIKIAPNLETMSRWLKSGEVDIYFDSPYPAMLVNAQSDALPILRRWRRGEAEYYAVIFARNDSGVNTLNDLKGKTIGLQDAGSTSGYLLPLSLLVKGGLKAVELKSAEISAPADHVGYVFTNDDDNTIQWVISKKVAAGAVDIRSYSKISADGRSKMIVLGESEKVPRQVVMVRPNMDKATQEVIYSLFTEMEKSSEGQIALKAFDETTRFDALPVGTLERMKELYTLVMNR
ncbi:MAG: phosphate/phosphite/phosphonate ABC transporter substrate-binding protein [Chloroflexi bacterium]|nr:phosphate/phosphite/phosphonate ABC transporter substrate-binding protein [Chloroflexota bacterium]